MGRKIIDNPNACSLVHAMNIIGGKWKPIILYLLSNGSLRFGKLLLFVPTISKKVLTEQLRELEQDGLIIRQKFNEIPPRVEYSLSEKGKALRPVLKALSNWAFDVFPEEEFEDCKIVS
ncbi:MAG: helix-turn-helix transcriptional regulator [Flavobacteriales bacterium]|nr:helix-turn-helix transcriptional regulator [Flavobacteriales bacterium]